MRLLKNRKGEMLGDLPSIAKNLFVVAVIMTLLAMVLVSFRDVQPNAAAPRGNVSLTFVNNTATPTGINDWVPGSEVVLGGNNNLYGVLGRGNYSVNYADGTITPLNVSPTGWWNSSTYNVSFSYYYGSFARNATSYGLTANTTLVSYLPTIALVLVATIIIGVVLVMFRRN